MDRRKTVVSLSCAAAGGVLLCGVIMGWRPCAERWYSWRMCDEGLPFEDRLAAAVRLREMRSPYLMRSAVEALVSYETERPVSLLLYEVLEDKWEEAAGFCVPELRRILRHGSSVSRYWAAKQLGDFGVAGSAALPEILAGFRAGSGEGGERVQYACVDALYGLCSDWVEREGLNRREDRVSFDDFCERFGVEEIAVTEAFTALTYHNSVPALESMLRIFDLVEPNEELEKVERHFVR